MVKDILEPIQTLGNIESMTKQMVHIDLLLTLQVMSQHRISLVLLLELIPLLIILVVQAMQQLQILVMQFSIEAIVIILVMVHSQLL